MNLDLNTMANYGFSFYNDELNEKDLQNLAEDAFNSDDLQMPAITSVSFVNFSAESSVAQHFCEPTPMESESIDHHSPTPESSCKDQVLMVIEQYNVQQSRSPSPAVSEASSSASSDSTAKTDSREDTTTPKDTTKSKKTRGRRITLPRGEELPGEFFCNLCIRNFRSQRGLRQHTNTHHTGIKAHGCNICGKRFDLLDEMKKHRERHSTENKPFGCRVDGCPKRFMHEFDMERHLAVRHGKAPFSCKICSKVFGRKDHLEKHTLSHKFNTVKKIKN